MVKSRIFLLSVMLLCSKCSEVTDDDLKTYAFSIQGSMILASTYAHVAMDIPLKPIMDMTDNVDTLMQQLFSTAMHTSMLEDLNNGLFLICFYYVGISEGKIMVVRNTMKFQFYFYLCRIHSKSRC